MVHNKENAVEDSMGENIDLQYNNLDEVLINLVKERPALYDIRIPMQNRTKIIKQALWFEISSLLENQLNADAAEVRWKYLRENYLKARKKQKIKEEIARQTGIPIKPCTKNRKYSFRYYEIMQFLNASLDYQKFIPLPSTKRAKSQQTSVSKIDNSKMIINPLVDASSQLHTANIKSEIFDNFEEVNNITQEDLPSSSHSTEELENHNASNANYRHNVNNYDQIFLEFLQKPIEKPSPIDGFLIRLGEGLKRLPYRERSKLELEFLTRLQEVEEQIEEQYNN